MTLAETIYQHCLNLPDDIAREALDYIEFLEQRYAKTKVHADETKRREALAFLDTVHIDWNGKPIPDRNALYDDVRN